MKIKDKEYFSIDAISNSKLKLFNPEEDGSPERYAQGYDEYAGYCKALVTGSALHAVLEEFNRFATIQATRPSAKLGEVCDKVRLDNSERELDAKILSACKIVDYYAKMADEDLLKKIKDNATAWTYINTPIVEDAIIVSPDIYEQIKGCYESVLNNRTCIQAMNPGIAVDIFKEDAYFHTFEIPINGDSGKTKLVELKTKAKLDNWSIDHRYKRVIINDFKTLGYPLETYGNKIVTIPGGETRINPGMFVTRKHYRQMAFYAFHLVEYLRKEFRNINDYSLTLNMIVVETRKPYRSALFEIPQKYIEYGNAEYQRLLKGIAFCEVYGYTSPEKYIL